MTEIPGLRRLRGPLAALGTGLLAVGTFLAFPTTRVESAPAPGLRAVLFDVSAGTTRRRPTFGVWARRRLREHALAAAGSGRELSLGVYAADARCLGLAEPELWLERLEGRGGQALQIGLEGLAALGSELDAGLASLEAELLRSDRRGATLVVYADLDYSGADPRPRLARLAAAGVGIEWHAPPAPELADLALEGLQLPRDPEPGAPLAARLELAFGPAGGGLAGSRAAGAASLELVVERGGTQRQELRALEIPAGAPDPDGYRRWNVAIDLGPALPGRTRVAAQATLTSSAGGSARDPLPENDRRSAFCHTGTTRSLGLVAPLERRAELRDWIGDSPERWPGLEWQLCEPAELPALLAQLDLVVSVDVAPRDLPQTLLAEYVRAGGAWLFCAGWRALPGWMPDAAAGGGAVLAELLPLAPAPEDPAPRDVVFLVDGSGSMEGAPFRAVQEALSQLVLSAPASDALRLQFFTGALANSVDLHVGGEAVDALQRLFEARVPGGPTAILYSLEQLLRQRAGSDRAALTFLLTDGKDDNSHDGARRGPQVAAGLSSAGSRLVVIAAGDEPDRRLLELLLAPGEVLHEAGDLAGLAEIFQREVFRGRTREGDLRAHAPSTGELPQTRALLEAWAGRAPAWPGHASYLLCEARPGADVLLISDDHDEPLMAWQRVGTGLVAAWASSTLDGWAPGLRGADDLFGPLLRSLARRAGEVREPTCTLSAGELELSDIPRAWPAALRAELLGVLWGAGLDRAAREESLGSAALGPAAPWPGADPRDFRRGPSPAAVARSAAGRPLWVRLFGADSNELLAQVPLDLACAPELSPGGARRLERPVETTAPRGAQATRPDLGRGPSPRAWVWVLLGLLGLFGAALCGALGSESPAGHQG